MDARRALTLSVFMLCLSLVRPVAAQSVALDLTACPEPAERDVRILAALELRGRLVERASADASLRIGVTCADERAVLTSDRRVAARTIDLATVPPPLRARLLALAIAELARGDRPAEVVSDPEPSPVASVVERASAPVTPSVPRATVERGRWAGFVALGGELQAEPAWGAAGALAALLRITGPLAWTGAFSLGQTRRAIDRGQLRIRSASLRTGPALSLERARYLLYAGLGARVTLFELTGEPNDRGATQGAQFRTFVIGPEAYGGLSYPLGEHMSMGLEAQLAQQLRTLRAEVAGGQALTLSSFRLALSALVGARW